MANLNIAIQIAANDKASGPIGKITSALGGLKDGALGGLQSAGKLAMGGIVAGAGLAVGAVGLIGKAAFGVADDMQTATGSIQAALGTTAEESERLAGIARNVWGNNFAGSITEAANAIGLVRQQLGDLSDNELQNATEDAFRLADSFGVDVPESISAANTLMEQFGLTSDQAFDFITKGFQSGLDRSGDFLDTIGEYSTQFSSGGADASQFFSLLESGLQGGMLGTDKAADAFKEFRVRIQDGSNSTITALESIGISSEAMTQYMADGTITAADAFEQVLDQLNLVDDTNLRMQAGVALLGTQFEDLGTEGALALSLVGTSLEDMAGAADTLDAKYNNLGSAAEGFKRRALLAIQPISDTLLNVVNLAMPLVNDLFSTFESKVGPVFEQVGSFLNGFISELQNGLGVWDAAVEAILNWTQVGEDNFAVILNTVTAVETFTGRVQEFLGQVQAAIQPVLDWVAGNVQLSDVLTAVGVVVAAVVLPALAGIVAAAAPVIAVGAALIAGIALVRNAWESDWGGIQGKVQTATAFIQNVITTVMTGIQTFWTAHGDTIMAVAEAAWGFIQWYIETATSVISSVFAAFKSAFEGDWTGFGENLRDATDTAWEAIKSIFSNAGTALLGWLSGFVLDLLAKFNDVDWAEVGWNIINGIAGAITAGAGAIADAAMNAARAALDAAKAFLGIESPSKVFRDQVGGNIVAGLVQALELGQRDVATAMTGLVTPPQLNGAGGARLATGGAAGGGGGGSTTVIFQRGAINAPGAAPGVEQLIRNEIERMFAAKGRRADTYIRTG